MMDVEDQELVNFSWRSISGSYLLSASHPRAKYRPEVILRY